MANPNKTARGSASTPASRGAADRRQRESDFAQDLERFLRGEMTADDFRRKHDPNFTTGATPHLNEGK